MKPAALLVDISRAGIVNRQDLADALKAGRLAGAAMDLCDPLPVSMTDPMPRRAANRSDAAYGMANQGNISPRRHHVSGQHFELFSRRTQPHRNPDALKLSR